MAEITKTYQITTQPGIQRDGTWLDSRRYSDGEWVRFYRGKPMKMRGYRSVIQTPKGIVRAAYTWQHEDYTRVFLFSRHGIEQYQVDLSWGITSSVLRTPSGFVAGEYCWTVDNMFDAAVGSDKTLLIAHANNALTNIDDPTGMDIYTGDITDTALLTAIPGMQVSGGVVAVSPHLFAYGSNGYLAWSNSNEPRNFTTGVANHMRATGSKIVKGLPIRGSANSPAIMLWSLDSVLRVSWVGGTELFKTDHLSSQSSILAQNGVIEYDGMYFWIGIDRFMYYSGSVQELPNDYNLRWFFDNLNFAQRQKIWATKMPAWGEIWWFFPSGDSVECDRAVIFNVRYKCWYDARLDRSAGFYSQTYPHPVMADPTPDATTGAYDIYVHDTGVDKVKSGVTTAIDSWFCTSDFGLPTGGTAGEQPVGANRWTRIVRVEPDFVQTGDMYLQVSGKEFANSAMVADLVETFTPTTERVDLRTQYREVMLKFGSNVVGGDYLMGAPLLQLEEDGVRS